QQVPAADEPKTWKDLLDPKWKGKIVMNDPGVAGGGSAFFVVSVVAPGYGEEFHRKLAQQDLQLVGQSREVGAIVARGERAIGLPGNNQGPGTQPGSPIKWLPLEDGLYRSSQVIAAIKGAPAPN